MTYRLRCRIGIHDWEPTGKPGRYVPIFPPGPSWGAPMGLVMEARCTVCQKVREIRPPVGREIEWIERITDHGR